MKRLVSGAILALAVPPMAGAATLPPIVAVHAIKAERDGLTIRVPPVGAGRCTPTRRMLTMAVDRGAGGVTLLVAVSGAPECRAPGPAADVRWTYAELGLKAGDPLRIANPLVAETAAAQPAVAAAGIDRRLCQRFEVVAEAAPGQGAVRILGPRGPIDIENPPLVAPGEVAGAEAGVDGGENVVRIALTPAAAARLSAWTGGHRGGRIAVLLDGQVIQETQVGGPIGATGLQISGMDRSRAVYVAGGISACSS